MPAQGIFAAAVRRHADGGTIRRHDADRREEHAQVRRDLRVRSARSAIVTTLRRIPRSPRRRTSSPTRSRTRNQPLPLPYTYPGLLPNNNPYAPAGPGARFLLALVLRAGAACTANCGYSELVVPRRRALSVRGRRARRSPSSNTAPTCKIPSTCRATLEERGWACA